LQKNRVLEKLEIERRFWAEQNIPLRIVTEHEFSPVLIRNLEQLRTQPSDKQSEPRVGFNQEQEDAVFAAIPRLSNLNLRRFCNIMDRELSLESGSTRALMRQLLMTKAVVTNLSVPVLDDHRPMTDFKQRAVLSGQEVA
jgi:hypothetical protein